MHSSYQFATKPWVTVYDTVPSALVNTNVALQLPFILSRSSAGIVNEQIFPLQLAAPVTVIKAPVSGLDTLSVAVPVSWSMPLPLSTFRVRRPLLEV